MASNMQVIEHIESKRDEIISFMQKIIQIPSVTGNEAEIGALMAKECVKDGLAVDIIEPKERAVGQQLQQALFILMPNGAHGSSP